MSNAKERWESIERAKRCGLSEDDAVAVRRIALTLHRWFELECGDSNDYTSWVITRGRKEMRYGQHPGGHGAHAVFLHDEGGKPYMETHYNRSKDNRVDYYPIADREAGARKRLDKIMSQYPHLKAYIQTDCRGGTIYLCKPEDATDSLYTRGVFIA